MISYYFHNNETKKLESISSYEKSCWISVINPSPEELSQLAEEFELDKDLLADGLDEHELPRLEIDEKKTYLFVKALLGETKSLGTLLVVFGQKLFLTISKSEPVFFGFLSSSKTEIDSAQEISAVLRLLNLINLDLERKVVEIVKVVQRQRKTTLKLDEKAMLQLLHQEDFFNNLISTYYYTSLLYPKMIKHLALSETEKTELKDLTIETTQGLNLCRTSLKKISNLRDHYNIFLSTKLNRKIKVLTIFTIFINIPAAISSLYGMNLALPFQNNSLAFYYVMLLVALSWIGFFYFMRKIDVI